MKVVINDVQYQVGQASTLLEAATSVGVAIPTLCAASHQTEKKHCDLCVVEVETKDGNSALVRACEHPTDDNIHFRTQSKALSEKRNLALAKLLSDHNADCEAPCQVACPAHVDVQSYLHHIAKGEHQKAVEIIKRHLPLPVSIGRVCPAFCEAQCRRSLIDEPLAIRQLKRHAADIDLQQNTPYQAKPVSNNGYNVAIVGAGPAGLACGYYLRQLGFSVTLFEAMPKPGGWLQYGIPEYRLPKKLLDQEIELLTASGMKILCNQ